MRTYQDEIKSLIGEVQTPVCELEKEEQMKKLATVLLIGATVYIVRTYHRFYKLFMGVGGK